MDAAISRPQDDRIRAAGASLAVVFVGAFLLFNAVDGFAYFEEAGYQWSRRDIATPFLNALVYSGVYFLCLAGLTVLYCHAWRPVRIFAQILTVATLTVYLGFKNVNGYGFSYHEASLFWMEWSYTGDAAVFFLRDYALALLLGVAALVAFERGVVPRIRLTRSLLLLGIPTLAIPVHARLLERTHSKVYETPIPFRIPMMLHYAYNYRTPYVGPRQEPVLRPSDTPLAEHIVLVMDESIRGDLLGVNGAPYATTPRLEALGDRILTYGVASALSNVSASSNIMLQSGLRPDQIPDTELHSLKDPSIFQHMQRAGFRPFLIDAQIYSEKPTNFMTRYDIDALAGHFFVRRLHPGLREYEMDFAALDLALDVISENERSFTYLLKTGAHFPYEDKYPPHMRRYQPTLGIGDVRRGRPETLHSYLNALSWTVDTFLAELVERLSKIDRRVLVVYTSDHGQSLLATVDGGITFLGFPHSTVENPPVQQAMVPLIVFGSGAGVQRELQRRYDPQLVDRVSSFEIFPTLMIAAGYDAEEVRGRYHHSLFEIDAPREERVFASGSLFGQGSGYESYQIRDDPSTHVNRFEPPALRNAQVAP